MPSCIVVSKPACDTGKFDSEQHMTATVQKTFALLLLTIFDEGGDESLQACDDGGDDHFVVERGIEIGCMLANNSCLLFKQRYQWSSQNDGQN